MALRHGGGEWYTKWTHTENGNVMSRRLHRLEIQAKDGRMYVLEGQRLPDFIQTCSGVGHKGKHLAQILLNRKNFPDQDRGLFRTWPNARDAGHIVIGLTFSVILFRILAFLAEATP